MVDSLDVWQLKLACVFSISILFYPITLEGRRGITDEFVTIPFHLVLFSAALVELAKSIPVHSLILSSRLFFCLPLFLFPFTMPCRIVFAKPEDLEIWPNHLIFRFDQDHHIKQGNISICWYGYAHSPVTKTVRVHLFKALLA